MPLRNVSGHVSLLKQRLLKRSIQWNIQQSRAKLSSLLIQHLTENHYMKSHGGSKHETTEESCYALNTLGNVLVKNWEVEWWKYVQKCDALTPIKKDFNFTKCRNGEIQCNILEQLHGNILPNGSLAMSGNIVQPDSKKKRTLVIMKRRSPPGEDYDAQFDQLGFLKKFFNKPSRIRVANGNSQSVKKNDCGIVYETDDGSLRIQEVKRYSNSKQQDTLHDAIFYLLDMEQLFLATVIDALGSRNRRSVLKLSPRLAPIKVVVQADTTIAAENPDLVQELCTMIRSWNIICWNGVEKNTGAVEADGLGVPFMVTLPNDVTQNGLLRLRSLDTSVEMLVHISRLSSMLQQYLTAT